MTLSRRRQRVSWVNCLESLKSFNLDASIASGFQKAIPYSMGPSTDPLPASSIPTWTLPLLQDSGMSERSNGPVPYTLASGGRGMGSSPSLRPMRAFMTSWVCSRSHKGFPFRLYRFDICSGALIVYQMVMMMVDRSWECPRTERQGREDMSNGKGRNVLATEEPGALK
eukprot:scaffold5532_cov180-Amphora_coffeaeformis.AAC.11